MATQPNPLREDLPERPPRIASLPVDKRGYPVPRFVALIDGEPDHRVINPPYLRHAVRRNACWICGEPLGAFKSFVLGPMCTVNRVSSEPPSHRECALYAVAACPFLSKPQMRRREAGLPEEIVDPAGGFIKRNPGAMCVWTCREFTAEVSPRGDGQASFLFFVGEPTGMEWFREGRPATRNEVLDAICTGLPLLKDIAAQDGLAAVHHLGKQTGVLMNLLDGYLPRAATCLGDD